MRKMALIVAFVAVLCSGVRAAEPPALTDIPYYQDATAGEQYTYDVDATGDPDPTFLLTKAPTGMTIDSVTGVIEWTPTQSQGGPTSVRVEAVNSEGSDWRGFRIRVTSDKFYPPVLEPIPDQTTNAKEWWRLDADATGYPAPSFSIQIDPLVFMIMDSRTGVVEWIPGWGQAGTYTVTVWASSPMGADRETFVLEVLPVMRTVTISSTEGGRVVSPGEGDFEIASGEPMTLEAVPDEGYRFVWWSGGTMPDELSATSTMYVGRDYTLLAVFEPIDGPRHTLTVSAGEGGGVATPGEGTFDYSEGISVAVRAYNESYYGFVNWTGTAVDAGKVADPTSRETTVTMDADYTLQANFVYMYLLRAESTPGGIVYGLGAVGHYYNPGTVVSVEAWADSGYHFTHWSGTAVDAGYVADPTSASTTVTVNADCRLVANFALGAPVPQRMLTVSSGAGGSVSTPGEGAYEYDDGTSVSIDAQVDEGYEFSGWTGTAVDAGKVASPASAGTTVTMDADYALRADFEAIPVLPWTLTVSCGRGGTVPSPGAGTFSYADGEHVFLEAEADPAHRFSHWSGSIFSTASTTSVSMNSDRHVQANFVSLLDVLHVDDDAPGDPGPCDATMSNSGEDGTAECPFDAIQEAIEMADEHVVIHVHPGTYFESIDLLGKSIRLTSMAGSDPGITPYPVIDGGDLNTAVTFASGEDANCVVEGFVITRGRGLRAGAVHCLNSDPVVTNCLIVGNRASHLDGAAVYCVDSNIVLVNCTISGNYGGQQGAGLYFGDSHVVMANSIVRDNLPTEILVDPSAEVSVLHSDVAGGWPGLGNIDIDPLFAAPGYWGDSADPSLTIEPDNPNAIWIDGDYHLMSHAGRWAQDILDWVLDIDTSLCIDGGDPLGGVGQEPAPHGDIVNMGAYGGTTQASKSP